MISRKEDVVLKAATGLEGGIVASGSTCGVISGGALGLALMYDDLLQEKGIAAEAGLLSLIGEYTRWFEQNYGPPFCRDRSGVDFYTICGQIRYFLPGDRVGRCLLHINRAIKHLYPYQEKELPLIDVNMKGKPVHCAQDVLKGIGERTGLSDPLLERLSIVFDGGVGLQGGACGALAGAIMGINLLLGMNIRDMNLFQSAKAFLVGHLNLLRDKPIKKPEPFNVGKEIVKRFREKAVAFECREITGKEFSGWEDFQKYISSSDKCKGLIKFAIDEASRAIERWR